MLKTKQESQEVALGLWDITYNMHAVIGKGIGIY